MADRLQFHHLQSIYAASAFDTDRGEATLVVRDATVVEALAIALQDAYIEDSGLTLLAGDPLAPLLGQVFKFSVGPPRLGLGLYAPSFDAFLLDRRARTQEPVRCHIVVSEDSDLDDVQSRYREVLRLVALLADAAVYLDREQAELVFVDKGRVVVPVDYTRGDLERLDLNRLGALLDSCTPDLHRTQKLAILAEAVVNMLAPVPLPLRFSHLLRELGTLEERFVLGYRLFASNFSYEKVRSEIEESRIRFSSKIHEALSGIQNQLLAIPVATIIVATQMRATTMIDAVWWTNTAVLVGCWVFVFLVNLLIRNQTQTLSVLDKEIERQELTMQKQYAGVKSMFDDVFSSLRKRSMSQHRVLRWINVVLFAGLVLAHVVYVALTEPVHHLLVSLTS